MSVYPKEKAAAAVKGALKRLAIDSKSPIFPCQMIPIKSGPRIKSAYYRAHQSRGFLPGNPNLWYEIVNKILTVPRDPQ